VDVGGNKAVFDPVQIFGDTQEPVDKKTAEGSFVKWRIQVDGRGLKEILGKFDL
jgi:hypothetical protein